MFKIKVNGIEISTDDTEEALALVQAISSPVPCRVSKTAQVGDVVRLRMPNELTITPPELRHVLCQLYEGEVQDAFTKLQRTLRTLGVQDDGSGALYQTRAKPTPVEKCMSLGVVRVISMLRTGDASATMQALLVLQQRCATTVLPDGPTCVTYLNTIAEDAVALKDARPSTVVLHMIEDALTLVDLSGLALLESVATARSSLSGIHHRMKADYDGGYAELVKYVNHNKEVEAHARRD